MTKKFLVVSGPSRGPLGTDSAQPNADGWIEEARESLRKRADELGVEVAWKRLEDEGGIVECLREASGEVAGAIVDPGDLAPGCEALRGAIAAMPVPCVEVFLNPCARDEIRHESVIASACVGVIGGFGQRGYALALEALATLPDA